MRSRPSAASPSNEAPVTIIPFANPASPGPIWLNAHANKAERNRQDRRAGEIEAARRAPVRRRIDRQHHDAASASGGLMANIQGQPKLSVSQPPSTGPPAVVSAEAAAQTPMRGIAFFLRIARSDQRQARRRQNRRRNPLHHPHAISQPIEGATTQAAEARPKPMQPTASMRALP